MDSDIKSQLDRAKELKKELEESYNSDLKSKIVSDKTRNLTQEILTKIRSLLDQAMCKFFEKEIAPSLSNENKNKARVYFPLINKKEYLIPLLGRAEIKNLEISHPTIFSFLESVQPYNANYQWLNDLSKYTRERHIRLTPQMIKEETETILGKGVRVRTSGSGKVTMRGCLINGIPVNSEDVSKTPLKNFDPRLNVKRTKWISLTFEGTNIDVLQFCSCSIVESEKIINHFSSLF